MTRSSLRGALLIGLASILLLGATCAPPEEADLNRDGITDEVSQSCEEFDDPMACDDAVAGCQETSVPEECTAAVYDCTETSEPAKCTEQIYDCTQTSDPEECTEQIYDCLESEEPMECPDATIGVLDRIGLNVGEHLKGRASYMPGPNCSGGEFMSPIRMSNLPPLVMIQDQGSFEQRTKGRVLSDGMTLVFVDQATNYDEMYVLQAEEEGELSGVSFHAAEGSLPSFGDIPRLDIELAEIIRTDDIDHVRSRARDVLDGKFCFYLVDLLQ